MKKKLLKALVIILGLIVIIFISAKLFLNSLKPTYEGNISLNNLENSVNILYDDFGIPHIYAKSELDAQRALGYSHAQDRLWQMELMKRIAPGKLSEIFGEAALENDKLFIGLGIEEASTEAIDLMDKNGANYKMAMTYLDGINQFIENGPTPIEYYILGIDKKPFELKDTYNVMGYMAFSFAMAHKTDPLLSSIQTKLGDEYLSELGIEIPANSTLIKNYNKNMEEISTAMNRVLENSPVPPLIGSNSWIVSPEKTKNGKVLFANDPHIGFSSPSVWYEAHLVSPEFESYGYYIAGIPFPLLSHNREYAYGITMFENDDIDFYQEENHPTDSLKYKFQNQYRFYKTTQKIIKIKDEEDLVIDLKSTHHGPVMNDLISSINNQNPISMSWIYTKMPNRLLNAFYEMSRAKNKDEFEKGVSQIYAPGLNIMYGDTQGNIAWWAAAQLYKLPEGSNSKLIMDGASGKNEIEEYLFFNQNPQAHNPSWNYVYSANNQPDSIAGMLYPGYYLPEDRAKRIVNLLDVKNDWTKDSFMEMITDDQSSVAPELAKLISEILENELALNNEKEALKALEHWKGDFTKESVAATIYTKFIYRYLVNTFEDELGEEGFINFSKTHLIGRTIAEQLEREESIWWNDINTSKTETRTDILKKSFTESIDALQNQLGNNIDNWTWNKVHILEHHHPIGEVAALRSYFNVGPFETNGTKEVINNLAFKYTNEGTYKVTAGPSTRRVIDFSDIENSMSILPTGNSGNPTSKFYRDQAEMYANNEFRKMKLNKKEIESVSTKLTLQPKK